MGMVQISLTLPEVLFKASRLYSEEYGYRSVQEMIADLVRHKVLFEDIERLRRIEERMDRGIGVKKMSQKEALKFLEEL